MYCQIKYTPEPKPWAYDEQVCQKALQLYVDGMNLRRIARHLGLHHRTVSLWVQQKSRQFATLFSPTFLSEFTLPLYCARARSSQDGRNGRIIHIYRSKKSGFIS
jgi:transposase-like protein